MTATTEHRDALISDVEAERLLTAARAYQAAGLHTIPLKGGKAPALPKDWMETMTPEQADATTLQKLESRSAVGIAIQAGPRSVRERSDGGFEVLLDLELEGKAATDPGWMAEWDEVLDNLDAKGIWETLKGGFTHESPSGGPHHFFRIRLASADGLETVRKSLPAVAAKRADKNEKSGAATYAELLADAGRFVVAPPTPGWVHPNPDYKTGPGWIATNGGPDAIPTLTLQEVYTLSNALLVMSDQEVIEGAAAGQAPQSMEVMEVSSRFNRQADNTATLDLLLDEGWTVHRDDGDGSEIQLTRPGKEPGSEKSLCLGGGDRPAGSVYCWTTSTGLFPSPGWYSAFDVYAAVKHDGDPDTAAAELQNTGVVVLKPRMLAPEDRRFVRPGSMETHRLVAQLVSAAKDARHPHDNDMPYAVALEEADGSPHTLATVALDGSLRRIADDRTLRSFWLEVCQPVVDTQTSVRMLHKFDPAVTELATDTALTSGTVSRARYAGSEPLLTPKGGTVSTPGYHRQHRALVAIPKRERRWWAKGYNVASAPTREQAQVALDTLVSQSLGVFGEFPYATAGDRARAAAYVLTLAARHLIDTCPGFVFDAPDRGTGKSSLATQPRIVAWGSQKATKVGYASRDDDESEKAVVATLIEGDHALHVDELPRDEQVSSKLMTQLLTTPDGGLRLRILGGNRQVTVSGLVVTVAGNNAQVGGDNQRRFIPIKLAVTKGQASKRNDFRIKDLAGYVRKHRPQLLAAAHTVLAHGLQNPSADHPNLATFETWSRVVIGSLSHLTVEGQNAAELVWDGRSEWEVENDELADDWGEVLAYIHGLGEGQHKMSDIHAKVTKAVSGPTLPPVLVQQIGQSETGAVKSWGRHFQSMSGTAVPHGDGLYRLHVIRNRKLGNRYLVEREDLEQPVAAPVETSPATEPTPPKNSVEDKKAPAKKRTTKKTSVPKKVVEKAAGTQTPAALPEGLITIEEQD